MVVVRLAVRYTTTRNLCVPKHRELGQPATEQHLVVAGNTQNRSKVRCEFSCLRTPEPVGRSAREIAPSPVTHPSETWKIDLRNEVIKSKLGKGNFDFFFYIFDLSSQVRQFNDRSEHYFIQLNRDDSRTDKVAAKSSRLRSKTFFTFLLLLICYFVFLVILRRGKSEGVAFVNHRAGWKDSNLFFVSANKECPSSAKT